MNKSTLVPRKEMSDLDWLARNVHEWQGSERCVSVCNGVVRWTVGIHPMDGLAWFTKSEWLARRAELQNKPSWDLSGSWSEYLAQDMDGEWKWLGENPALGDEYWTADELRSQCKGVVIGNWYDTLEKRPEQFKPFTSIEDNQDQKMKQDDGWFEREELPPVGARCEVLIASEHQWVEFEVVCHRDGFALGWCQKERCGFYGDKPTDFRPIRTERDVLIEMLADFDGSPASAGAVADAILAVGFKRDGGEK